MTVELVVKIDENIYRRLKSGNYGLSVSNTCAYEVLNGIPLEKHDEKIIKETVASIWGKPPYTEVLDKIQAEIERYQADCNLSCSDDANCKICDKITFDTICRIIDKYR